MSSLAKSLADEWPDPLRGSAIAAIGPTTAGAAREAGLDEVHTARRPSLDALVELCIDLTASN